MADRSGYIGRAPGDSSVIIARQSYTPSGVTTDFTFSSGYTPGYVDVYLNGSRLIVASDYTATDGSTVGLTSAAQNGDVLELVAYKAFNLGNIVSALGDFDVAGVLSVTGISTFTNDLYVGGDLYVADDIVYDEVTGRNLSITGIATIGIVTGATYYGDGSNLTGIAVTSDINTNNIQVSGITTLTGYVSTGSTVGAAGSIYFPDNKGINFGGQPEGDLQIYHDGSHSYIKDSGTGKLRILSNEVLIGNPADSENVAKFIENGAVELYYDNSKKFETTQTGAVATGIHTATVALHAGSTITADAGSGIVTATKFKGDGSQLTGVGGDMDITSCLFI